MKTFFSVLAMMAFSLGVAIAQEPAEENDATGLPVPRFVSLRSNRINARSGPGARYPIEWVYMQ